MLAENMRIKSKTELKDFLNKELSRYPCKFISKFLLLGEGAILRRHCILLRKAEYYTNIHKKIRGLFYRVRLSRLQSKYCLHIPINCCGKGLHIMHLGPILINGNATIGENSSIHINTAIVAGGTNNGVPILGNNVVVGVGAVILGEINIADNIAVGANAVVNKSFLEPNIAIAGVPAKKISDNGSLSWGRK